MVRVAEDARRLRPERVPPHNLEAEESVLGSMMLSTEAVAEVIEEIKPEDFYRSAHRVVFESLVHLYGRGEPTDQKDEVVLVRSLVDQTMEELEHIHQRESAYSGIPSGFRDLDELLSGLQKGNLIVVAARPGVGKSSFVTNLVRNVTVEGTSAALFSLEM